MKNESSPADTLVHRFHSIIDSITGLPEADIANTEDHVQAGEWVLALENLTTQLYEYDVALPPNILDSIATLGRDIGMDRHYCTQLRSIGAQGP
ncbi:MAG TPA: MafI family immunity protein [Actinomycetota bacterium]|nr:MafI family immunity protein [Actinomycetota bacterium]